MGKIKVSDKLPEYDTIVLAWGETHEGPALGQWRKKDNGKDDDYWEVQPFYEAQYWTYGGIDSWQPIDDEELEIIQNLSDEETNDIHTRWFLRR